MIKVKQILNFCSEVGLTITQYGGTRVIRPGEKLPGIDIDPEKLNRRAIQPGSKRLFPQEKLNHGEALRARAASACERWGVKHPYRRGLSYIVENTYLDKLLAELELIEKEFWDWVQTQFSEPEYSKAVQEWAEENPDMKDVILSYAPSADEARSTFEWVVSVDSLAPSTSESEPERVRRYKSQSAEKTVMSLSDQLLGEIAKEADKVIKASFEAGRRPTRRLISPLRRAEEKLRALSLVSSYAIPLADHIASVVQPIEGGKAPLTGQEVAALSSLYTLLSSPERVKETFKAMGAEDAESPAALQLDGLDEESEPSERVEGDAAAEESASTSQEDEADEGDSNANVIELVI